MDNHCGGLPQCQYFMSRQCVPTPTRPARGVDALERLCEHVNTFRTRPLVGEDFERVERELHERFVEAEREVLGELLESLDVDVASVGLGERRLHRVLKSTESYTTAVGPVKVARTLYRCARERAVAPMELRAGIVEGHWTVSPSTKPAPTCVPDHQPTI